MVIHHKTRRRQKPIGALNSARIGESAEPKILIFSRKNWWGLERAQNMRKMSISRVWVVLDKKRLVGWTQLGLGGMVSQNKFKNVFLKNRWGLERAKKR
jgi:hypothetical protein